MFVYLLPDLTIVDWATALESLALPQQTGSASQHVRYLDTNDIKQSQLESHSFLAVVAMIFKIYKFAAYRFLRS